MATFEYSAFLSKIVGKVGDKFFYQGKYGEVVAELPKSAASKSVLLQEKEIIFSIVSRHWQLITQTQRDNWNRFARSLRFKNKVGGTYSGVGHNIFIKLNFNRIIIHEDLCFDPPNIKPSVPLFSITSASASSSSENINSLFISLNPKITPDAKLILYATKPLSPGISNTNKGFVIISILDSSFSDQTNLAEDYFKIHKTFPANNQKIFLKLRPINIESGFDGMEFKTYTIAESGI